MIYADHAATTKLDIEAYTAMTPYLIEDYGNASQPYVFSKKPKEALRDARKMIAKCIGASPEEIYFTSGGTESDNWVIKGIAQKYDNQCEIITSSIEHHAILNACESIKKQGCTISYLNVDTDGVTLSKELETKIDQSTKLVSIMYANNEIGSIQPIKELCEVAHKCNVLFHTDAVQAVGHTQINVKELDVDMLSASAHKFNGPKGIGFLYIKNGVELPALIDGGQQEHGMRAGTENVASIVGMAIALKNNCENMKQNLVALEKMENQLLDIFLHSKLDFRRNGSIDHIPGNISLSFRGLEGEMLLHRLDLMGICVSTGSACDSKMTQISHVLQAIKIPTEYAEGTIRISLGKENTYEDINRIGKAIIKIAQ